MRIVTERIAGERCAAQSRREELARVRREEGMDDEEGGRKSPCVCYPPGGLR